MTVSVGQPLRPLVTTFLPPARLWRLCVRLVTSLLSASVKEPAGKEPIQDPILSVIKPGAKPADIPTAGRTPPHRASRLGSRGILHLLGPGVITGARHDDPSGIGTYSPGRSQFRLGLPCLAL